MDESSINHLESQVNQLIHVCDKLREENHTLVTAQAHAFEERDGLHEKLQTAQAKIEALLIRLKSDEGV